MGSLDQHSSVHHLSPRIYVPKLLYFSINEDPQTITSTLSTALSASLTALPILGGTVGLLPGASQTGALAVQAPFFTARDIISVKYLRDTYDYPSISSKNFPQDAVDGNLVSPDLVGNPSRVMLAQANLIPGGLILVFAIHHYVVDETGIFDVMKLWSTFCRGGNGAELVKSEWTGRTPLMKGEGTGGLQDHLEYTLLPAEKSATLGAKSTEYISKSSETSASVIFFFSDERLWKLKEAASAKVGDGAWISTNNALCALIWSRVTAARNSSGGLVDAKYSMFNMTVNGRSCLEPPMSAEYMGNVVFVSKAAIALPDLTSSPARLAETARVVQDSILAVDNKAIKDKIKAISEVDDIGRLAPGGYNSFGRNLGCTSWSGQQYYEMDWANVLGGKCRRVRWRRNVSDGIFVIFPRIPGGEELGEGGLEVCILGCRGRLWGF